MTFDFDAIIIGARIAGSIMATVLGQRGYRILLLDRARFPSDTLSTHFFRWPAFRAFERIGILDQVFSVAPKLINNFNAVDGRVFTEPVESPEGPGFYLCVRRITLDAILTNRVRQELSVSFLEGTFVENLLMEESRVVGVQWQEDGIRRRATGSVIIGADGIHSVVTKHTQPTFERSEPVRRAMFYAYYENLEAKAGPAAEFHYRGNRLVYVFPTDADLKLLAASVPIDEFREFRQDADVRLRSELEAMPELRDRLRPAGRTSPVKGAGNIPGYQRFPFGSGWVLVGDSGQIMDPWSGQGIDQASTHATILSDSLDNWLSRKVSWQDAMREFNKKRHEFSDKTFERTCTYARDLRPMTEAALRKRGLL